MLLPRFWRAAPVSLLFVLVATSTTSTVAATDAGAPIGALPTVIDLFLLPTTVHESPLPDLGAPWGPTRMANNSRAR
jgi:hypothetical protein